MQNVSNPFRVHLRTKEVASPLSSNFLSAEPVYYINVQVSPLSNHISTARCCSTEYDTLFDLYRR
jgi:hypothetical protein